MNNQNANTIVAQVAPVNTNQTVVAASTKKSFSLAHFFVGVTGENYDDLVTYRAKARYVTIGFMTLMDPLLSWYLFTMAFSLNKTILEALLFGFATALIIFLIEVVLVRTTPLGALYKLFTGKIQGAAIAFFLISFLMRFGIAYKLGDLNSRRATVVLYSDGIDAFTKKNELAKREADIKEGRARQDVRATQAQKAEEVLSASEAAHQKELLKGAPGRKAGAGNVAGKLEDTKKQQAERLAAQEAERKATNAKEEAEAAELKKLSEKAKSDDYVTKSRTLDEMAKLNPSIAHDMSNIDWLCILIGVLAFVTKSMMPPGAYERFKESREEQLIAQIEIDALALTQKLSEAKLQESIARQKIGNAEKQILLADPISYMNKYATEAYKLINKIEDKGSKEAARRAIDGHINRAIDHTLNYERVKVDIEESMPTTT